MLDLVIVVIGCVATAVLGLLVILFFGWGSEDDKKRSVGAPDIPRWSTAPVDAELGDLGELAKHGSLHQYLRHLHKKGQVPVTSFWWGKTKVVSVCNPQAFKELVGLVNRPVLLFKGFEPLIGAASIQYANDGDWEQRQKCLYKTLKGEELKGYFPKFVSIAQETESKWHGYSPTDDVAIVKEVFPMTIKGICLTCFGDVFNSEEELDRLSAAYHCCWREMEERIVSGVPEEGSSRAAEFQKNRQVMMDIITRVIRTRRGEMGSGQLEEIPFVDSMLQNYSSEDKIISDVMAFMVGGFHTSGYLMTWMLWYLAANPASQDRLVEEIRQEVGGECGERLKKYALRTDTFMRQVQDETLRLSTLAPWAARYGDKDVKVCGYHVPAKTPIITALGVSLKNLKEWEDEEKWDPDRFAASGPHGKRGNEFCPFGIHSRRKCPGYLFSYFEVSVFMAILLQSFEVTPVAGQKVTQVHGLVTEPESEIYVNLRPRNQA